MATHAPKDEIEPHRRLGRPEYITIIDVQLEPLGILILLEAGVVCRCFKAAAGR